MAIEYHLARWFTSETWRCSIVLCIILYLNRRVSTRISSDHCSGAHGQPRPVKLQCHSCHHQRWAHHQRPQQQLAATAPVFGVDQQQSSHAAEDHDTLDLVFTNNHPKWWNIKDIYRYLLNGGGWNYMELWNFEATTHKFTEHKPLVTEVWPSFIYPYMISPVSLSPLVVLANITCLSAKKHQCLSLMFRCQSWRNSAQTLFFTNRKSSHNL